MESTTIVLTFIIMSALKILGVIDVSWLVVIWSGFIVSAAIWLLFAAFLFIVYLFVRLSEGPKNW